ncbi:MAG: hypothetical protein IT439_04965 [Phycisphaerales bacterium]|nr:hypothetical protein [Phycisphaerales bacterium]
MSRMFRTASIALLATGIAAATWSALRFNRAAREVSTAERDLARWRSAVHVHQQLRSEAALVPLLPESLVAERIVECLRAAGTGPEHVQSLDPQEPITLEGGVQKRRLGLILEGLTLPQVGGFLASLAERAPEWTIDRIELVQMSNRRGDPGADRPLRLTLGAQALSRVGARP